MLFRVENSHRVPDQDYSDPTTCLTHKFGLSEERWKSLNNKFFWITGAGTGYGRCVAIALAAANAQVLISGRRDDKLNDTIRSADNLGIDTSRIYSIPLDITSNTEIESASKVIKSITPCIHGLINSAALPQKDHVFPLINGNYENWKDMIDTNLTGQWLVSKTALSHIGDESFRIIFLSSEAGWADTLGFGPYNISKTALNSLCMSLAVECEENYKEMDVQVNTIVPGEAFTEMNQGSENSPFKIVHKTLELLTHGDNGPNGCFFHMDGRQFKFIDSTYKEY